MQAKEEMIVNIPAPPMERHFVIWNDKKGIWMGGEYWTITNPDPLVNVVPCFTFADASTKILNELSSQDGLYAKRQVEPDRRTLHDFKWASEDACANAGLPRWIKGKGNF